MAYNAHIRDFLNYYCNLPKEPQYAVLLNGLWGSGKTWFIKDFIKNHLSQPERVLYLSLYGTQSFDDIESELFRLLHPVLGSKPARLLHRVARGLLKTSINFDLDGDDKSDGSISGGVPTEKILEKVSVDPTRILVLDDLERCSIPVADIIGYVNQFIEHGGLKAILIANETELLKRDSDIKVGYAQIKEKLIGRTFEVVPEVASALESFAADLPTSRAQEVVRTNFSLIAQVYECSKYKNLRLVRHALWEFDRLTQSLEKSALRSDPLLADLLALFLSYSFEVHSGTVKTTDVRKLHNTFPRYSINNPNEADPDQRFHDIRAKYSGLNLYTFLLTDPVCEAIFSTGSIPKADLNESLLRSKYFQSENQPNWVKLWYGANLSDEEFGSIFSKVQTEWSSRTYRQLGEVIHVTGLFVRFAKHGIYDATADKVIESAKDYIDHLLESGDIPRLQPNSRPSPFEQDAYAGLGYTSLQEEPFIEFLQYIEEQRRSDLSASLPEDAHKLLELIGTDTSLFYRRIIINNNSDNIYYETPILHLIEPNKFLDCLLRATPEERRVVAIAIKERYQIEQFNIKLLPELDWLCTIVGLLREEITMRTGKISSLSIKQLVEPYLTDAIAQLEKTKLLNQRDASN